MRKLFYYHHRGLLYNPDRPRAPWTLDGIHYFNQGNLCECETSDFYGYGFRYDKKAIRFDKGSDIEQLRLSVKSDGCTLACVYRESKDTAKAEIIGEYFERTHSIKWVYVIRKSGYSELYEMNATEFREFVETFGGLSRESGKFYYKVKIRTTQKMEDWLMARA